MHRRDITTIVNRQRETSLPQLCNEVALVRISRLEFEGPALAGTLDSAAIRRDGVDD